ncbi:MAG: hypothetical protein WCH74_10340 [Chloroflexota bacterium]
MRRRSGLWPTDPRCLPGGGAWAALADAVGPEVISVGDVIARGGFDSFAGASADSTHVPAMGEDQATAMAEVVRTHAQPVGSQGQELIRLTTWNDRQETTTFEPTVATGSRCRAGDHAFDMLEGVCDVFGPETFAR